MKAKYIIRLDDACEKMDVSLWQRMEDLLDKYSIKPLVGIIPHCEDVKMNGYEIDSLFWDKAHKWIDKGWDIALHGYNHVYSSNDAGIFPLWQKSEFAGLSLTEQKLKISKGLFELEKHKIFPRFFFAPSHTFDLNTLLALKEESCIRFISDMIAIEPFEMNDFTFIPQQIGHCVKMPFGTWTFCFHPNIMKEEEFVKLEQFLINNHQKFIRISDIGYSHRKLSYIDKMINSLYFLFRRLKGIK